MGAKGAPPRAYCVPVEPFLRLIDEWLAKEMPRWAASGVRDRSRDRIHPTTLLGQMIWPGASKGASARRLFAFREEQTWIDFDLADHILCVLEKAHLWVTDPEFNEIYETVPLPTLDFVRPTCETAHAESVAEVERLVETIGIGACAKTYGLHPITIKRNLPKPTPPSEEERAARQRASREHLDRMHARTRARAAA